MASAPKTKAEASYEVPLRTAQRAVTAIANYVQERKLAIEKGLITDYTEAIRLMNELDLFTTDLATRAKTPAEKVYDTLRFTSIPNLMDGDGITNIGVEGVGKVHLQDDVSVKTEDKTALMAWLTGNELEDMITEQVNAQTLAAFVRRRIREAAEQSAKSKKPVVPVLPGDNIITIKPLVRAVIVRG